jgi:hypothetical protein
MPQTNKLPAPGWNDPAMLAMLQTKPTAHILAVLKKRGIAMTKSAISSARRLRGIPSPQGHGGSRTGAGRKPLIPRG